MQRTSLVHLSIWSEAVTVKSQRKLRLCAVVVGRMAVGTAKLVPAVLHAFLRVEPSFWKALSAARANAVLRSL